MAYQRSLKSPPPRAFSLHAAHYASVWDSDPAARAQRAQVHALLGSVLPPRARVLDVGCGTGTDAAWLLSQGHSVVGIDAAEGMIEQARQAAPGGSFSVLPAESLADHAPALGPLDAAMLNFGVGNVVDLRRVAAGLRRVLPLGAPVVVVFMPRLNPAWFAGALRRGRVGQAAARLRRQAAVPVEGQPVTVTYLRPREVVDAFAPWFTPEAARSLGALAPPPGSRRRGPRLDAGLEPALGALGVGDHVALVLRRSEAPAPVGRLRRAARRLRVDRAASRGEPALQTLILEVTTGCQSRCVACSYRGPAGGEPLTPAVAGALAREAVALGAQEALLTGGEPLLRSDLWALADAVQREGLRLTLLTNGLALRRHAARVAQWMDAVVVSLDGVDRETYRAARGVDGWLALAGGLAALRREAPRLPVTARVTVTAANAAHLVAIVGRATQLGIDSVSLLAPDATTPDALGRQGSAESARDAVQQVDPGVVRAQLSALVDQGLRRHLSDSDAALERILARLVADQGGPPTASPRCDAPTTAALVTADLALRPCFFLPADGDVRGGLASGLTAARPSRRALSLPTNPTCARCVCWARQA